jgi:phenylalanyl-tRNA synthetase beta chain
MRDLGFSEIVAWSFTAPSVSERLRLPRGDPRRGQIAIHNPLSEEQSVMRTTLLGALLDAARHNVARGAERVALFESGRVYLRAPVSDGGVLAGRFAGRGPAPVAEPHRLGCLVVGALAPYSWRGEAGPAGFFELRAVLDALCGQLGARASLVATSEPFLHPGRAAEVRLAGRPAGWLGEIHPLVARGWDLSAATGFELHAEALFEAARAGDGQYEDVTTYPAVYEDIAVAVDEEVPAGQVREAVLRGGGELLRSAQLFDLYRGEQVGGGRKSLALRLEFRAPDRTLTDAEVAERRAAIADAIAELGGSLRE